MANYPIGHAAEFFPKSKNPLQIWNGTCGQIALAQCLLSSTHGDVSTLNAQRLMDQLAYAMIQANLCKPNGAATLAALAQMARNKGAQIVYQHNYLEPLPYAIWHDGQFGIERQAGINPIVLQVARGRNLIDAKTHAADEAGLNYHAIAVLDKCEAGYICADGDNPGANSENQIYTRETLINAVPCGMLIIKTMLKPTPAPKPPVQPQPTPAPVPTPPSQVEVPVSEMTAIKAAFVQLEAGITQMKNALGV